MGAFRQNMYPFERISKIKFERELFENYILRFVDLTILQSLSYRSSVLRQLNFNLRYSRLHQLTLTLNNLNLTIFHFDRFLRLILMIPQNFATW